MTRVVLPSTPPAPPRAGFPTLALGCANIAPEAFHECLLYAGVRQGWAAGLTDTVEQVLGRAP